MHVNPQPARKGAEENDVFPVIKKERRLIGQTLQQGNDIKIKTIKF